MSEPIYSPDGKWMWSGTEWIPAPPKSSSPSANVNLHDSVIGGDVNITHNDANPDAIGEGFKKAILDLRVDDFEEKKRIEVESEQARLNVQENRLRFKTDAQIIQITTNSKDNYGKFYHEIDSDKYPCSFPELRTLLLSAKEFWAVRVTCNDKHMKDTFDEVFEVIYYRRDQPIKVEHYIYEGNEAYSSACAIEDSDDLYDFTPTEAVEYLMTVISMNLKGDYQVQGSERVWDRNLWW